MEDADVKQETDKLDVQGFNPVVKQPGTLSEIFTAIENRKDRV